MQVSLGAIVRYVLTASDVETIRQQRTRCPAHNGSTPYAGAVLPMMITRVDGKNVSGKVLLDGTDVLWVQDVRHQETKRGCWSWPPEAELAEV